MLVQDRPTLLDAACWPCFKQYCTLLLNTCTFCIEHFSTDTAETVQYYTLKKALQVSKC